MIARMLRHAYLALLLAALSAAAKAQDTAPMTDLGTPVGSPWIDVRESSG